MCDGLTPEEIELRIHTNPELEVRFDELGLADLHTKNLTYIFDVGGFTSTKDMPYHKMNSEELTRQAFKDLASKLEAQGVNMVTVTFEK